MTLAQGNKATFLLTIVLTVAVLVAVLALSPSKYWRFSKIQGTTVTSQLRQPFYQEDCKSPLAASGDCERTRTFHRHFNEIQRNETKDRLDLLVEHRLEPMALSLDYWEQMGNALNSLYDLQCWARSVGITKVLEPFLTQGGGSTFHFLPGDKSSYTLHDLFDIDAWNKMSLRHSHATLVPLQTFLDNAVKKIVYVQIIYKEYQSSLESMESIRNKGWYKYLTSKGFQIVNVVCIDFDSPVSVASFQRQIFSENGYSVSLIFRLWRGIRSQRKYRIRLKGSSCNGQLIKMADVETVLTKPQSITYVHANSSSPLVLNHTLSGYVDDFRREFMQGAEYMAVMIRSERMKPSLLSTGKNRCFYNILSDWNHMRAMVNNNLKTLFFSDVGEYGSGTWKEQPTSRFLSTVQNSLHVKRTISDVNHYLERTTGYKDAILIAAMHREIVAHAKCVIMVGGGVFQRQTLNLFAHYHSGEELCYSFRSSTCVSEYIHRVYDAS